MSFAAGWTGTDVIAREFEELFNQHNKPGTGMLNDYFMADLKIPTCGRIVHYYPNKEDYPKILPAIVITEYDTCPSLHVFTEDESIPSFLVKTVLHKSVQLENNPYWDWPEIK